MRLATFNLESFGEDRFRPERLGRRLEALGPRLNELAADILCLQEVNAQKPKGGKIREFSALEFLLAETPYAGFHRAASLREDLQGPMDRHNLLVLSRYPIEKVRVLHHAHVTPPLWRPGSVAAQGADDCSVRFDRPLLQVRLDIGGGKPLHVFVVHLRAPIASALPGGKLGAMAWKSTAAWAEGYFIASMKRVAQALDLRLAVDAILDEDTDALIAVAGDFNATGDASALRLLFADPEDTGNPALACRQLFQLDAALPREVRKTVVHNGRGQTLDHILASGPLKQRMADISVFNADLADEVIDEGTDAENGSFHAAVCATFEL
ncbi:endonuclease/exonuclease/phosphatase family protein [Roseibium sp.]|uniref:endonuclease/exonuclease/phosphatase family protein n=1 Tax=Roseibium sp. TaxID=1936156 RepID=UPI003A980DB4